MALLSLLAWLGEKFRLTLNVVHFDHGLRAAESEEDSLFVAHLCQDLAIPCVIKQLNMNSCNSPQQGHSLQDTARNIRYHELARLALDMGANKIATGHTADDQAEDNDYVACPRDWKLVACAGFRLCGSPMLFVRFLTSAGPSCCFI